MSVLHGEVRWRVSIRREAISRDCNSDTEALDEAHRLQCFSERRVSVISYPRLPERLLRDLAVRSTRVLDLDTVREPGNANRRGRSFIGPVEHRVADQLPERLLRLIGRLLANRATDVRGAADVEAHDLVRLA